MKRTVNIGVIGMGWMGQAHSRSYRMIPDRFPECGAEPRLVICADSVPERAKEMETRLGFEQSTTDWREVIDHPDVEVVNIGTPTTLHLEIALAAAEAGKHIYCEKPVGREPKETAEIEYAARKAGVLTFTGFNYRWAPLVQYARQLAQDGKLGALTHYRGRFFSMYGSNPHGMLTWRFHRDIAGLGVLADIMSHVIDMAHMMVGPIKRVVANTHIFIKQRPLPYEGAESHFALGKPGDPTGEVTNEDYAGALVQFENGVQGTLEVCRAIFGPKCQMAFEMNGTAGAANWDFERMNELELYLPGETGFHDGFMRLVGGPAYPYHGHFNPGAGIGMGYEDLKIIEAYEFLQSIAEGKQRAPGFTEILAVAEVIAAMMRSEESGTWEEVTSLRRDD